MDQWILECRWGYVLKVLKCVLLNLRYILQKANPGGKSMKSILLIFGVDERAVVTEPACRCRVLVSVPPPSISSYRCSSRHLNQAMKSSGSAQMNPWEFSKVGSQTWKDIAPVWHSLMNIHPRNDNNCSCVCSKSMFVQGCSELNSFPSQTSASWGSVCTQLLN